MDFHKSEIAGFIKKSKKSSKLNKTETGEVILLLGAMLNEDTSSVKEVINALNELHYAVTREFFKTVFPTLDKRVKDDIVSAFLHSEKIIKNAKNFGMNRKIQVVNALLQINENDECLHTILKVCAKQTYGKDGGQKAGELLSKICFEDTKDKVIILDYSTWKENELRSLSSWIGNAIAGTSDNTVIAAYNAFLEKYNLPKSKRPEVENDMLPKNSERMIKPSPKAKTNNAKTSMHLEEKIIELFNDLQYEARKLINERMRLTKDIDEAKDQLEQINKEKADLSMQLSEEHSRNELLQREIRLKEQQLSDAENRISDINNRLRNSFHADKSQQNQELMSLKNNIVKRLKLEYEDFSKISSKEPAMQYYEALKIIIENIFDTLRRNGIVVTKESER
jgi:hypothetical protein